jgi:hypothetical protein
MCESGRKLSPVSVPPSNGTAVADACTLEKMLSCVSITPFGSPVVPLV